MPRFMLNVLMLTLIVSAILISGCSNEMPIGKSDDSILADGHVYLDNKTVAGAQIRAVSANGTYRISNVTDGNGNYMLYLPNGTTYNLTVSYRGMKHTAWPVAAGTYDINLSKTPRSFIEGKGRALGGPYGWDPSMYKFNNTSIVARPANGNDTIIAKVGPDGRYSLEVRPGVQYEIKSDFFWPAHLHYRNMPKGYGGFKMNLTLSPDETVLIDFEVILP